MRRLALLLALLLALPAHAGTFVQIVDASNVTAAQSSIATGNFGTNPTAGNLIVAAAFYYDGGAKTVSFSDTCGNTYTIVEQYHEGSTNFLGVATAYAKNITGCGANSVTANFGSAVDGNAQAVLAMEYSGFDTTTPHVSGEDAGVNLQTAPTTSTDATTSGNTATLGAQPGTLIGCSFIFGSTSRPAAGTGFTSRLGANGWNTTFTSYRCEDKAIAATTAVPATFTAASNTSHYTWALYLRNAATNTAASKVFHRWQQFE